PENLDAIEHEAEWSFFVYMAADCDLAECMFDNLLAMKKIGSSRDVHICVFFHGPLLTDTFFARLNRESHLRDDFIFRFVNAYSNKPETLKQALVNNMALYPARKKMVILSGHGLGWRGALRDDATWKLYQRSRNIFHPSVDIADDIALLESDRQKVMTQIRGRINPSALFKGSIFDILAFDACDMGNIETQRHFFDMAKFLVVSEVKEYGIGYPYEAILQKITSSPCINPREIAAFLVETMGASSRAAYGENPPVPITQIVVESSRFPDLLRHFNVFARELTSYLNNGGGDLITNCIKQTYSFDRLHRDLKGLILNLLDENGLPESLRFAANSFVNLFDQSGLILAQDVPGGRYLPNGLSVYLPPPEKFIQNYKEIAGGDPGLQSWMSFLSAYYNYMLAGHPEKNPVTMST
ncbi:MAG: clostripain-related cysteine peptidase, partial [Candidatus Omnitrophica bacterium]|nr:clostripain-related cysteine peptidase [Candidatus Omnitrophota bacterium]